MRRACKFGRMAGIVSPDLDSRESGGESGWIGRSRRFRGRNLRFDRGHSASGNVRSPGGIGANRDWRGGGNWRVSANRSMDRHRSRLVQSKVAFAAVTASQALRAKVIVAGVFRAAGTNLHRRFAANTTDKWHAKLLLSPRSLPGGLGRGRRFGGDDAAAALRFPVHHRTFLFPLRGQIDDIRLKAVPVRTVLGR